MNDTRTIANEALLPQVCLLLAQGRHVKLRAKGGSMQPFIDGERDTLVLVPPPARLRRGDVVLACTDEDGYVIHRIVLLQGDRVVLMGDGNLARCESCSRSGIQGHVTTRIRCGKSRSLSSPAARAAAFLWWLLLPLRRYLLWAWRRTRRARTNIQSDK